MLNRTIAKFLFYAVTIVLMAWTSSLTYSFLSTALPNTFWLVPVLGLVIFDVGMIAWLFVFLSHAEGAIQRAVAIVLCLFNFVGVSLMTISEILLDGQQMVEAPAMLGTIAIWAIGIWTTVNVLGVLVFHLGDNQARRAMAYQAEKDAVFDASLSDLKTRRIAAQKQLSAEMSAAMMDEMVAELRADVDGDGRRDVFERPGAVGKPIPTVVNSTHDVPAAKLEPTQPAAPGRGGVSWGEFEALVTEIVARRQGAPSPNGQEGNGSVPRP